MVSHYDKRLRAIASYYAGAEGGDVVQELWLKLWQYISENKSYLYEIRDLDAWLFRVTKYQCLDHLRGRETVQRRKVCVSFEERHELLDALVASGDGPEELAVKKETRRYLRACVSRLKELYSLPLTLYYFEGFTLCEIAGHLSLTVSDVKWRLYAGRQQLKKMIVKGGL